jgi:hypothetical protein
LLSQAHFVLDWLGRLYWLLGLLSLLRLLFFFLFIIIIWLQHFVKFIVSVDLLRELDELRFITLVLRWHCLLV